MENLYRFFRQKLADTPTDYIRSIHNKIEWDDRLVAITGARGVGKSTLVLQHIKLHENIKDVLYVSADNIYFSANTLFGLAEQFYTNGGKVLYIDEIHKYSGWSQEIKNIYDTYSGLKVCYTGSSILDLEKGGADLSRRKLEYRMNGISFREYIAIKYGAEVPVHTLEQILANNIEFPYRTYRPVALFKEYLQEGYYPFFSEKGYYLRLNSIIQKILGEDIPQYADLSVSTVQKLKKLLYIIAQSVPFKPNYSKLALELNLNRNFVSDLVIWLEKAQIINTLRTHTQGISSLGKVDKVYLNNTNLAYALSDTIPDKGNLRETIFLALTKPVHSVTSAQAGDFKIADYTFEVGGKNKTQKQIQGVQNAYIVKDDIEYGYNNILPLWAFGLLY